MEGKGEGIFDCLVIGGGPAGLTAAIYLGRFRRSVRLIDAGDSRAALIPVSHNYPGFPEGIGGEQLLQRLRAQAARYCGEAVVQGIVSRIRKSGDGPFEAESDLGTCRARNVILATGVVDIEPELPDIEGAVRRGLIRHCPICDGYEAAGRKVALIGHGKSGLREALFIRHFTDDLTLLTLGRDMALDERERALLGDAGIKVVEEAVDAVECKGGRIAALRFAAGAAHVFDTLYSSLGTQVRSALARDLGVDLAQNGEILTDRSGRTNVEGLYAVGDVVKGLNQICSGTGQAAVAATDIHNSRRLDCPWRK